MNVKHIMSHCYDFVKCAVNMMILNPTNGYLFATIGKEISPLCMYK